MKKPLTNPIKYMNDFRYRHSCDKYMIIFNGLWILEPEKETQYGTTLQSG